MRAIGLAGELPTAREGKGMRAVRVELYDQRVTITQGPCARVVPFSVFKVEAQIKALVFACMSGAGLAA
jgi:hypothetical protein